MVVQADRETVVPTISTESLHARLHKKVSGYEERYGIASVDLQDALKSGRLTETLDICGWLIAWEAMDALGRGGGPARLE